MGEESFVYFCPNCGYMRTEEEIELNRTTEIVNGEYYAWCVRCKQTHPVCDYKVRKI